MKLGTNDTKRQNWKYRDEFISDCKDMINCFENLPARVAEKKNVAVIDLYKPLSNKRGLFPDLIGPNAQGAELIAREVYKALTGEQVRDIKQVSKLPKVLISGRRP